MSQETHQIPAAGAPLAEPSIPGWSSLVDGLRDLAPKMLAKLPPALRGDPRIQQELGRLMLEALAQNCIEAIAADGDRPLFLPLSNVVLGVFQPNADTVYKKAVITPGGSYRLRGRAGSVRIARIGTMAPPGPGGAIKASQYYDLKALETDADGRFDVLLSPSKPEGHAGDWWQLDPDVYLLLFRAVAYDWSKEGDPALSIERIDAPATRPRPSAADLEKRLRTVAPATSFAALMLVDHVEQLRKEGFINTFKVWDVVANFGGLFGQFYYECVYELHDDEALIIESEVPRNCGYASLLLTNQIFETTDWYNNHSSLNGAQWQVNADGRLRVVISVRDPGVHNWLDTAGYPVGIVQGRWTDCSSTPMPSARKVALAEVATLLPSDTASVTPAQRDRIIRDRRASYQQRVLW